MFYYVFSESTDSGDPKIMYTFKQEDVNKEFLDKNSIQHLSSITVKDNVFEYFSVIYALGVYVDSSEKYNVEYIGGSVMFYNGSPWSNYSCHFDKDVIVFESKENNAYIVYATEGYAKSKNIEIKNLK